MNVLDKLKQEYKEERPWVLMWNDTFSDEHGFEEFAEEECAREMLIDLKEEHGENLEYELKKEEEKYNAKLESVEDVRKVIHDRIKRHKKASSNLLNNEIDELVRLAGVKG